MKNYKYPYILDYKPMDYIWGGQKLRENWNKQGQRIAESWELSFNAGHISKITNGALKGKTLEDILTEFPNFFGNTMRFGHFPLLVKLIDATAPLSVQVHPSDEYALREEKQLGKREMWYILDAEEGASIYLGLKRSVTKAELSESIKNNSVESLLNTLHVKKGDAFLVPEGTLHALRGGTVLLEIQENSGITYRVYDYDRTDSNGNKRELHIEKALDVTCLSAMDIPKQHFNQETVYQGEKRVLCADEFFRVEEYTVLDTLTLGAEESFISVTITEGKGSFSALGQENWMVNKGDTIFLPAKGKFVARALGGEFKFVAATANQEITIFNEKN